MYKYYFNFIKSLFSKFYRKLAFILVNFCLFVFFTVSSRSIGGINHWDENYTQNVRKKLEKYWSSRIHHSFFKDSNDKEKMYILSMFPYPSGQLHMGHVRVYGISDTLARFFRMRGKNVIHPMGWDAFGLPAENAAFERNLDPEVWTQKNIANMKSVMEELNFSFDWDREIATCDSDYYKWTQFFFLKLYECGLVYRNDAFVNWDPVDQTVLAEEQIDINGRSWRSGALVEKKIMRQWFVRTTKFSKSLFEGLKDSTLNDWKDIIDVQKHWIGSVNGTLIFFEVVDKQMENKQRLMPIWSKNPEHIDKGKFVAVKFDSFWAFGCNEAGTLTYSVKNPFTNEIIPVILTSAVKFPEGVDTHLGIPEINDADKEIAESYQISFNRNFQILASEQELLDFREKVCAEARERNIGGYPCSSKLKDWLISRQRYWGTPIPIIYCEKCGEQPVPEKDLPLKLPSIKSIKKGENTLKNLKEWVTTTCPKCGGEAERETDTMDTFVDSSWYFLRYLDPDNVHAPFEVEKIKKLMPVDIYIGGKEHATLHLFYARFMNHFFHSVGLVPHREPFKRLLTQGMVKAKTYKSEKTGEYVKSSLVEMKNGDFFEKVTDEKLVINWEKMSKSKHNAVEPKNLLSEIGVDTLRLALLYSASPKSDVEWSDAQIRNVMIWQNRLWSIVAEFIKLRNKKSSSFEETEDFKKFDFYAFDSRNFYVKTVTNALEKALDISKALKKLQGLTNSLRKCNADVVTFSENYERALAVHIIMLAPAAPYFASELWAGFLKAPYRLCKSGEILWDCSVFEQPWPKLDENYLEKSNKILEMIKVVEPKSKGQIKKEKKRKRLAALQMSEDV